MKTMKEVNWKAVIEAVIRILMIIGSLVAGIWNADVKGGDDATEVTLSAWQIGDMGDALIYAASWLTTAVTSACAYVLPLVSAGSIS